MLFLDLVYHHWASLHLVANINEGQYLIRTRLGLLVFNTDKAV